MQRSRISVTGRGGIEIDSGWGTVLLVSVSKGVQRTTSPCQVSTSPPGKYNFSLLPRQLILAILEQTIRVTGMRYHNPEHKQGLIAFVNLKTTNFHCKNLRRTTI